MQTRVINGCDSKLSEREAWTRLPRALRSLMNYKVVVSEAGRLSAVLFCQSFTDNGGSIDLNNVIAEGHHRFQQITLEWCYSTHATMHFGGQGCAWTLRPIETESEIEWRDRPDWEDNERQ